MIEVNKNRQKDKIVVLYYYN